MKSACFILSTGRCGTQWLADFMQRHYSDTFHVTHEPLYNRYQPRKLLGMSDPSEHILAHAKTINGYLQTKHYIECGHPCWGAIPWLMTRFNGQVRVIHLTRHPVPTAYSWLTHRAYCPPLAPYLPEKVLLSPFDTGVQFPEYQTRWPSMTPLEKCLYYWAEVNAFGLGLEAKNNTPWLRLSFEDLFHGDGLKKLGFFLDLSWEKRPSKKNAPVDKHRFVMDAWHDWRSIHQHPRIIEVASRLGYDVDNIDEEKLTMRYLP